MAFDPNAPGAWSWVPPEWDTSMADVPPVPPLELPDPNAPPPPLVEPPSINRRKHMIGEAATPTQEEVPAGAMQLSPAEEAQIQIDQPPASGILTPPLLGEADAVSSPAPSTVAQAVDVTGIDRSQPAPTLDEQLAPSEAALPSIREREDQQGAEQLARDMAGKSPEEQALFLAKIQTTKDNFAASRALEESRKAAERSDELLRVREDAIKASRARRAQLETQAKQIADTDPASTIPGYKKLFGVLAAFVGGFAANKTGRNMGLEVVDSIANEAAQAQQQKLGLIQKQIAGTGEDIATAEDTYRHGQAALVATYDLASKAIQAEAQLYDPKGTLAARLLGLWQEIQGRRADVLGKFQQQDFENQMKAGDLAIKARQQGLAETKFLTEEQRKAAAAGAGGAAKAVKPEDVRYTADGLRAQGIAIPPDVQLPAEGWTIRQAKSVAETAKSVQDWQKAARENSPQERARQFGVGELVDEKGDALTFRSSESAEKVATLKASADFGVQLLDRMIAAREKYGWSSDLLKSPEWREMKADFAQYALEKKNVDQLGVLAGPDMGLIHEAAGTSDPTEMRDPTPGLRRARENVVEKLNSNVRAQVAPGIVPKRWDPPKPPAPAPTTASEELFKTLKAYDPGRSVSAAQVIAEMGLQDAPKAQQDEALRTATRPDAPLLPSVKEQIERVYAASTDPNLSDAEHKKAEAQMRELASSAESKAVRAYASQLQTTPLNPGTSPYLSKD